jgi:hypothetical protein
VIRFAERGTTAAPRPGETSDGAEGRVEHASPGMAAIVDCLDPESKIRVLDLGPAVPANISFLSQYSSHIRIADAVADLRAIVPNEDDPSVVPSAVAEVLPAEPGDFDLVLVWDLLSYLSSEVVESLADQLKTACRAGAKVLLLVHSGSTMPAEPQVFEIRSRDQLVYRAASSDSEPARELPPAEVERILDGFRIESSFVLRHGIREFVAVRM